MKTHFKTFAKDSLFIFLISSIISCDMFNDLENDEDNQIDEVEYSYYSGYWNINTAFRPQNQEVKYSKKDVLTEEFQLDEKVINRLNGSINYNLGLYRPDNWSSYIYYSNSSSSESSVSLDDPIYVGYSVVNTGSETYSVYYGHPEAKIAVYWDDELIDEFVLELLSAYTFQSTTFEVIDYYGNLDLSPGTHNVVVELKMGGSVQGTQSRVVEIEAPEFNIDKIELTENFYVVESANGYHYGSVTSSSSQITLNGYGILYINSQQNDYLEGEIELFSGRSERDAKSVIPITMERIAPVISDSPMVNLLCHDPWELVNTTSSTAVTGTLWRFTKSGFYDFVNSSGVQRKYWGYTSESELTYGFSSSNLNGSVNVVEITSDKLVLEDFQNTFEFSKYNSY